MNSECRTGEAARRLLSEALCSTLKPRSLVIYTECYLHFRFPSVLPILEPSYVVNQIVEAVLTNQSVLCTPRIVYPLLALKS